MDTPQSFQHQLLQDLLHISPPTQHLWIAYSGGLDSSVLLQALAALRQNIEQFKLHAIHIHHGLHPQADDWAKHCQQTSESLDIPCEVIRVKIHVAPRESLEACARTARYEAITQLLAPDDVVLTAQHADDQAETVLLQLLRGAGVAGLAAMPQVSRLEPGWLVRPLLAYTRVQLHAYAQQINLSWLEDSSNADTRFDRNFMRHEIMPLLQQRWSSVSHTLCRVARHQAEADELIQILAAQDWQNCQGNGPDQLLLSPLSHLSPARQRQLLRFWLKKLSLSIPTTLQLQQIINDMLTAKADAQPLVRWHGCEVRRYHNTLYAMPNLPTVPDSSQHFTWSLPTPKPLPLGQLSVKKVSGEGLILPAGSPLQIRFRIGGEKFYWHGHWRVVKKLLQAAKLLPWQRKFIPLIYLENVLVVIPNIGIHDHFIAQDGEMGWEITWLIVNDCNYSVLAC